MSVAARHAEWLSLVEHAGPFLALPVLEEVLPQGLDVVEPGERRRLRSAYEEWREAVDQGDTDAEALHREWVRLALEEALEYGDEDLTPRGELDAALSYTSPEHGWTVTPDMAVIADGEARLLITTYPADTDLDAPVREDGGVASPVERMSLLCRHADVPIGLVTDGERWTLVNRATNDATGYASWYARLWFQEPLTLQAFRSLLGVRRCFGPAHDRLESLLERSLEFQEEVTDTLGQQVRRAVEVLVQALDRADEDRNRELLRDAEPRELYEAGLTVMMRLVFVLCAEERGLLLLGDSDYDEHYAVSPLRAQLQEEAGQHGQELLERRHDAWSRLLSVFRAVYGGIEHESLRLPAMGGSLFDPDRFPFLEGRSKDTHWQEASAAPLPIDNRTVLMLLRALQVLEQPGGAVTLSYKALDVEQIGHVYEGLLEYTVARNKRTTLGMTGSQRAKNPNVALSELESARMDGEESLLELLLDVTGRSRSALQNALAKEVDESVYDDLLQVCGGDTELADRVRPFVHLLRKDNWGDPLVYRENSLAVTLGTDRRETGTHYTPKSITEAVVQTTLEPLVYIGPAEGEAREDWRLKRPDELLDLKVCDPAMGSGAFLVQACRWLAERLVESWAAEEEAGRSLTANGEVVEELGDREPMATELAQRLVAARRLVAERCLYGVDMNPLAVELAKLSLWLTTLAKGRPFGFLAHNLHCGDSLFGIHTLEQVTEFRLHPKRKNDQIRLFGRQIRQALDEAIELRLRLRETPIRDIRDVQRMERLDAAARGKVEIPERVADRLMEEVFRSNGDGRALENSLSGLSVEVENWFVPATTDSSEEEPEAMPVAAEEPGVYKKRGRVTPETCHWPLEFPEVFRDGGFDAFVGNPPFLGGKRVSTVLGTSYNSYLATSHPGASKNTDLCAHFFRRTFNLVKDGGHVGLLAVNTISQGDTRQGGLEWLLKNGAVIHSAHPSEPWPGKAAVVTSRVHLRKGYWRALRQLEGKTVDHISAYLAQQREWSPKLLKSNKNIAFQGSTLLGMGFVLTEERAHAMLDENPKNAQVVLPYLNGDDLNSAADQSPSRWVINFWDWPEEKAMEYEEPYEWIKKHVYPERLQKSKKKSYRDIMSIWWLHYRARPALYHAVGRGHHFESHPKDCKSSGEWVRNVLANARVSKYFNPSLVPNKYVFHEKIVVLADQRDCFFAFMNSSIADHWVRKQSSTLGSTLNFAPSDAFETFPFPTCSIDESKFELDTLGRDYRQLRGQIMDERNVSLTALYNRFHDPNSMDDEIQSLRSLQIEIDNTVTSAYLWHDLRLDHDFHKVSYLPEGDSVRFTISEAAQHEILERLSKLNHERNRSEESGAQKCDAGPRSARQGSIQASENGQASIRFGDGS